MNEEVRSPGGGEEGPFQIYTNPPARYIPLPNGFMEFDAPCNVIVERATTCLYQAGAESRLSIRCAFHGQRIFEAEGGRYAIDDHTYLLLNPGQEVSSYVESLTPVTFFNVTFQPGFAEEVLRSLVTPADRLLDIPWGVTSDQVRFFVKLYPHDALLSPVLFQLRSLLKTAPVSQGWLEEQFHLLLERMLQVHRNVYREVEQLPAVRQATRAEIYQRLYRARDFMEASLSQPLSLQEIAHVACFAPHHFLRLFKQVFHETPHQYLTRLRLERARALLLKTDWSVTAICMLVGFESLGSFSWLFSRRFSMSPTAFRSQCDRSVCR